MIKIVKYYADWCQPCKIVSKTLEELKGDYELEEINIDQHREETAQAGVMGIPTLVFMRDGKEVNRKVGITSLTELQDIIAG